MPAGSWGPRCKIQCHMEEDGRHNRGLILVLREGGRGLQEVLLELMDCPPGPGTWPLRGERLGSLVRVTGAFCCQGLRQGSRG